MTERKTAILRITCIVLFVNLALTGLKLYFAYRGHSNALLADSLHSGLDSVTTLFILLSLGIGRISGKEKAERRNKLLAILELVLSMAVILFIGLLSARFVRILASRSYLANVPRVQTTAASGISVIVKVILAVVSFILAKKLKAVSLQRDGMDHVSDAVSSVIGLVGIILSGIGFRFMDPIAGIMILCFVAETTVRTLIDAVTVLLDKTRDDWLEERIRSAVDVFPEILSVETADTELIGEDCYVDVDIVMDPELSLAEAEAAAKRFEDYVEFEALNIRDCVVRIKPGTGAGNEKD